MANILAVDDSVSIRTLVSATLEGAAHSVVLAENGEDALSVAEKKAVELVITDVNMPGMNGIELVGKLRELPTYKFVPILVLTTEMDPAKKSAAKAAGATGWLVKPFDPDILLKTVAKVLG
ncbi:MAG: response regulator [Myxococcota bacterium]